MNFLLQQPPYIITAIAVGVGLLWFLWIKRYSPK